MFVLPSSPEKQSTNQIQSAQKTQRSIDNVSGLLKTIPHEQLFLVLNQIEIARRSSTKSSRITTQYEGVVRDVISSPSANPPYPRLQIVINEKKDKIIAAYSEQELLVLSIFKKDGESEVKSDLESVKTGNVVSINEEFDIKGNKLLKSEIHIQ